MSVVTLLLLLVAMGVGIFFYRRKKSKPISENTQDEEEEEVLEEEEEEMDAADMIATEKKADIAIQKTKRKVSVAASMAKKKENEAAAALAAKKKAEAEAREAKRKKDAQAALIAKKKAEAAAALAAKKKAEAEAYKRKLAKAREEKRKAEAARRLKEMPVGVDMRPGYPKRGWVNDTLNINYGKIKNQSAKQCRQHAIKMNKSKPGYVRLWGHRTNANTCLFYTNNKTFTSTNDPIAPKFGDRAGWTSDKRYISGCVESGRRVASGCKDPNAIRNEKAVYKKKLADEAARKAQAEAARKEAARVEAARKAREEAARKAYEEEVARVEAEKKKKERIAAARAERKRRAEEAKKKRDEAKKKRDAAKAAWKKLQKQNKELNNLLYNAKQKEKTCTDGAWNGVNLKNAYKKVYHRNYWFAGMRIYRPRWRRRPRIKDQKIRKRKMSVPTFAHGDLKMEVRTGKVKTGKTRYVAGRGMVKMEAYSYATTKTRIYVKKCRVRASRRYGKPMREGCKWNLLKSYDGHLFVDGNRLMIRKAKKFAKPWWAFYLKDVEIAKFDKNVHEKCAIVLVSGRGIRGDRKVLFVQSNNNEKSYDLVAGKWVDHPYPKCTTKEDLLKKSCDINIKNPNPRCPPGYDGLGLGNLFARTKVCPPGRRRIVDKRTGKTIRCRSW